MSKIKIFVEGVADVKFIKQYIKYLYNIDLAEGIDIIECNGWEKIDSQQVVNEMQKQTDNGGKNIVIFDADNDPIARRQEIMNKVQQCYQTIDLFLFPDNKNKGVLENLLMSIINNENQPVVDCWDRYEDDLAKQIISWKNPPVPTIPAMKTKVYAYLEALLGETKSQKKLIKEAERKYTNANHWNLNSPNLRPLKDFLDKYKTDFNPDIQ